MGTHGISITRDAQRVPDRRPGACRRRSNLPAAPTPLVGRAPELRSACERLRLDSVRLVTLTGPGGSGKTRLALAIGEQLAESFADGVWLVDLAPVREHRLVLAAVARALGVQQAGRRPILETLCERLCEQQALMVLDNCEHVLEAGAEIAELLAACRQIKVLATSREPLRLRWEHELPVPPLPVPDLQDIPGPAALRAIPSVELFMQRAQAVCPSVALTDESAQAVAALCVRLDGLPLALELAAAWTRLLPVQSIVLHLERGLGLLASEDRDRPARHRTLGEALGWSYDLLDDEERALFRQLSIFVGGCTLEAVEAVRGAGAGGEAEGPGGAAPTLTVLRSLLDKSLVWRDESDECSPRFRMLETVRELARERLQADGELDAVAERHAAHFLALAEGAEPWVYTAEQQAWLARLRQEYPNIRAALAWGQARPAATALWARLATTLGWYWWLQDDLSEGRYWLDLVLAAIPVDSAGASVRRIRTKALNMAGMFARGQGEYERAVALLADGLRAARQAGDRRETSWSLIVRAAVATDQVDPDRGAAVCEEALAICRAEGDDSMAALALYFLGFMARGSGAYERALVYHEESLVLRRTIGDTWGIAWSLHDLGLVALGRADLQRAEGLLSESLGLLRELKHQRGVAWALNDLGAVTLATGNVAEAHGLLVEALLLRRRQGDRRGIAESLEYLGAVARSGGDPERGARLLGAAVALREAIGTPCWPTERARREREVAEARSALGGAGFEAACADGRLLSLDTAVAEAQAIVVGQADAVAATRAGPDPRARLTPREREVAALIARGCSNREIAALLVISPHTAERHVEHILAKLDCSSRAEIAAWATRYAVADEQR